MRVIAGDLRSRRLHAPTGSGTRPTHDRVKEALFSVLGELRDTKVVDLFAGTGALGIEALSRGARHAIFVERSRQALECLQRNLVDLGLVETSTVLSRAVEGSAAELVRLGPHDIVFCDPPWSNLAEVVTTLGRMSPPRWLSPDGLLVLEHPAKLAPMRAPIVGLVAIEQRSWGDTAVTFYRVAPAPETDDIANRS